MQSVRIWTRVAVSISCDDNHYTTGTSSMLLLYILWDDWPIFMISASNEQLQQQLECTLLKSDCHSWWISKMQSGREDTLEERYAIKFSFKLGKKCHRNVWNASDCFWSILHELNISFWVAGSLWGTMRGVGGVRKSINQSWLAKGLGLGLGLLCCDIKVFQEEILWEEASTLQIGSVAFPPGQYISPQLLPCHRLFD